MYDVVALGELLIDFIQNGSSAKGNPIFEANPGGAPCNVLAMLSHLGYQTAFIGKVGEDYFGRMLGETIRSYAKSTGKIISFDSNLRELLWESEEQSREAIWYGIGKCDVLKIADTEIKWLTGKEDYDEGVQMIRVRSNAKLINVTLGKAGSLAYYMDKKTYGRPFLSDRTIDTTGAGDTFCACVIGFLLEHGLDDLAEADLDTMLSFANAAASIVTTRKGAIQSMPDREEVDALLANYEQDQEEPKAAKSFDIFLGSVDKVKAFVNDMSKIEGEVFLCVGKYVIDAKSIMGIFSLELSKPLRLEIEGWKEENVTVIEKYLY